MTKIVNAKMVAFLLAPALVALWAPTASALPPRSERVTARIAERAYARQAIAESRAERAGARVEAIAPVAPVPPPPRPATVRRMLRAGVPLEGILAASQPPATPRVVLIPLPAVGPTPGAAPAAVVTGPAPIAPAPLARTPVPASPRMLSGIPSARPAAPVPVAPTPETAAAATLEFPQAAPPAAVAEQRDEIGADGTRSVLVAGEEPTAAETPTPANGPEPIELLPVPTPR